MPLEIQKPTDTQVLFHNIFLIEFFVKQSLKTKSKNDTQIRHLKKSARRRW